MKNKRTEPYPRYTHITWKSLWEDEALHELPVEHLNKLFNWLNPKRKSRGCNGITICWIEHPNILLIGAAKCSKKDNFCKAAGRKIASTRATTNAIRGCVAAKIEGRKQKLEAIRHTLEIIYRPNLTKC